MPANLFPTTPLLYFGDDHSPWSSPSEPSDNLLDVRERGGTTSADASLRDRSKDNFEVHSSLFAVKDSREALLATAASAS